MASSLPSSQISHLISFGFILLVEEAEDVAVASTVEVKRLTGSEEAESGGVVAAAACLPFLPRRFSTAGGTGTAAGVGISKTARHIGHVKGGLPMTAKWNGCSKERKSRKKGKCTDRVKSIDQGSQGKQNGGMGGSSGDHEEIHGR